VSRPYEKNLRRNDKAVEAAARSIREFGFRQPIMHSGAHFAESPNIPENP